MVTFVDTEDKIIAVGGQNEQYVSHGSAATAPALPSGCSGWSVPYTNITGNTTIKALSSGETHVTITFDWNYTGAPGSFTVQADSDSAIFEPGGGERTGYIFDGWYSNADGTGTKLQTGTSVSADATYYAKWKPIVYEVKFADGGSQTISTQKVTFGQDATPPAAPAVEGYRFIGWDKDYTNIQSSILVTALYEAIPKYNFEVSCGAMGSITPGEGAWVYQGESIMFTITPLPGYAVSRLLVDGVNVGTGTSYTFSDVQDNHVISAEFKLMMHTVTFNKYDGTTISAQDVPHGCAATVPATIERFGYTFTGWSKATDNVTEDMTVYATYQARMYTVSHISHPIDLF